MGSRDANLTCVRACTKMAEVHVEEIKDQQQQPTPQDTKQSEAKPEVQELPSKNEPGIVKSKEKLRESSQGNHIDVLVGAQSLLTVVVLSLCCVISFSSRLFAVIRFESIIHEFDPWWVRDDIRVLLVYMYNVYEISYKPETGVHVSIHMKDVCM